MLDWHSSSLLTEHLAWMLNVNAEGIDLRGVEVGEEVDMVVA